jgi:dTDP-4-amino-4,6-dideoxygalactose transaminase
MNIHQLLTAVNGIGKQQHGGNTEQCLAIDGGFPVRREFLSSLPYRYSREDACAVSEVILSGKLSHDQGEEIKSLEREFAGHMGTTYALATNSGTSALQLACKAVGLQPGDEVIVPAYTFVASAQAVLSCGAIPVFADIDDTFTISPKSITTSVTKRTRAIMVVHMFGNVCHMDEIVRFAKRHSLAVIEDCAQAVGARFGGREVGSIGDVGCFSFNSKKAIPTGQGGMLVTSDRALYHRAKVARNTGIEIKNKQTDVVSFGGTYYMTEMEAILARSVLRQLHALNTVRRNNFGYLMRLTEELKPYCKLYSVFPRSEPSYSRAAFTVDFDQLGVSREWFIGAVRAEGIPVTTFYPIPLYRYSLFRSHKDMLTQTRFPFSKNSAIRYESLHLPNTERFCRHQVAMEFSPYWTFQDMRDIAEAFHKVIRYITNK